MSPQDLRLYRSLLSCPAWQQHKNNLPVEVAKWLLHTSSLTEKLQGICHCFQVEVLQEGWQHIAQRGLCWVREVVLKCGTTEWIFAQTILPQATIDNVAQPVLTLGEKAIGLWLFPQNPKRISLEWQRKNSLYARRSELLLKGYPIEIKELFLKDFPFTYETNHSAV
ncbi:4-hydroxybenzoate synthetase (Chorismate lyase) [Bibersteinia trehalosi USDA-ARS-USMARC-188]|uniref:4-hydroxybenzoate synthetase (Chorismate lyase) n=1 Tax=Bibersteinia trehalosi USDA-ARS-USMARC-188 TaxID=1263829 RepID=A0A4V7I739_BIBTR|nr:chorismate lyase [Bibersteinia trehalosi]AHG80830.1 4-hydroxybenzoate synthetase (Chorismate lyase) [Bibersteinia trehalosi USDA-ARS-USMARC-188]